MPAPVPVEVEIAPERVIFKNAEGFSTFAILDGASVPGLLKQLYEHEPEYCCLYRGELEPDMAAVAPYLIRLEAATPFAQLVLKNGWGVHWGIFMSSSATVRMLRDHFRQFQTVQLPDERTVLFRYYDPRILRVFLPACNSEELVSFFGPVQAFVVETDSRETAARFVLADKALKTEKVELKKPTT